MLASGSAGKTHQELVTTLYGAENGERRLKQMLDVSRNIEPTTLKIANAIVGTSMPLSPSFMQVCKSDFNAVIEAGNDSLKGQSAKQTNGAVNNGRSASSNHERFSLISSIYLKATWTDQFERDATNDAAFVCANGISKKVKMMNKFFLAGRRVGTIGGATVLRLPYGSERQESDLKKQAFAMYLFLPAKGSSPEALLASLTNAKLNAAIGAMSSKKVDVSLPRFSIEADNSLTTTLKKMGVSCAFDPDRSDFSNMVTEPGWTLATVKQKTAITTNESGTEASAITEAIMYMGIGNSNVKIEFNRPFAFLIRDERAGTIMFMGAVNEPTSKDLTKDEIKAQLSDKAYAKLAEAQKFSAVHKQGSHTPWEERDKLAQAADLFEQSGKVDQAIASYKKLIALGQSGNLPATDSMLRLSHLYERQHNPNLQLQMLKQLVQAYYYQSIPNRDGQGSGCVYDFGGWESALQEYEQLLHKMKRDASNIAVERERLLKAKVISEVPDPNREHVQGLPDAKFSISVASLKQAINAFAQQMEVKDAELAKVLKSGPKMNYNLRSDDAPGEYGIAAAQSTLASFYEKTGARQDLAAKLYALSLMNSLKASDYEQLKKTFPRAISAFRKAGVANSESLEPAIERCTKSGDLLQEHKHAIWKIQYERDQASSRKSDSR